MHRSPPRDNAKKTNEPSFKIPRRASTYGLDDFLREIFGETGRNQSAERAEVQARTPPVSTVQSAQADLKMVRAYHKHTARINGAFEERTRAAYEAYLDYYEAEAEARDKLRRKIAKKVFGGLLTETDDPAEATCKPQDKPSRDEDHDDKDEGPSSTGPPATSSVENVDIAV